MVFSSRCPPPRPPGRRCPTLPAAGPRLSACPLGSSPQECSPPLAAQALRPAVLNCNSRGRRLNREGSRRPRGLCRGHGYHDPRRRRYLPDYTTPSSYNALKRYQRFVQRCVLCHVCVCVCEIKLWTTRA